MSHDFSLERVLEYREGLEKDFKEKFAYKQNQVLQKQQELKALVDEHNAVKRKTSSYKNISEMTREQLYRQNLGDKISAVKIALAELIKDLDLSREELVSAQKDRKVMDKLKEKEVKKHNHKVKISEEKTLDEVNTLRFARGDL